MTQLAVVVNVVSWPSAHLHNVGTNFLVPITDWHLKGGELGTINFEIARRTQDMTEGTSCTCSKDAGNEVGLFSGC